MSSEGEQKMYSQNELEAQIDEAVASYNQRKSELVDNINSMEREIQNNQQDIDVKDTEVQLKQRRLQDQQKNINSKEQLVALRNRMLQIAQEKNIYKQKVIYSLSAIILVLIAAGATGYAISSKKSNNGSGN